MKHFLTTIVFLLVTSTSALAQNCATNCISGVTATNVTDTTVTPVIAAQPGLRVYLSSIVIQNSDATVSTWVRVKNGTTTVARYYAPALGGGVVVTLPSPLRGATATAWNIEAETTGAEISATLVGYTRQ